MEKSSNRIKEIDEIKVFATICVLILHSGNLGRVFNVIHYMSGCAIPLFYMCSGAILLNRDVNYRYIAKKCISIIRIILIWSIIFSAINFCFTKKVHTIDICVKSIVQEGDMRLFWYLWATCILYILTPLLKCIIDKFGWKFVGCLCAICIALSIFSIIQGIFNFPIFESFLPQSFRLWVSVTYYMIGGMLRRIEVPVIFNKIPLICVVLMCGVVGMIQYVLTQAIMKVTSPEYCFTNPIIICLNIIIFEIFLVGRMNKLRLDKFIDFSLGIYIIHALLINIFSYMGIWNEMTAYMGWVNFVVLMGTSVVIVLIIRKIPIVKRIIEL